jgi:hypothetical protein
MAGEPSLVPAFGVPEMPESTVTSKPEAADPLKSAADSMAMAVQAARDGASDAQAKVSEMMPAIGGFLSRLTYTTCYAVSYGVVFPTLLVARAVPKDNVIVQGLVEGGRAAMAAAYKGSSAEESPASDSHHGPIIPGGDEAV